MSCCSDRDTFIVEDDDSSSDDGVSASRGRSRTASAASRPASAHLRRLLMLQRERPPLSASSNATLVRGVSAGTAVGPSLKLREFSEEVQRARASAEVPGLLESHTYLDLQNFDTGHFAEKQRRDAPGSLQLMYMFYSRIYDKLVGKQKGVDVPLFSPLSLTEPLLGFHAILDWARDFKVTPSRVGRRELERIFATVHGGPQLPLERFSSKINYLQFLQLVALCGDAGEPMDRSVLDGSRVRVDHTRLEKVKSIVRFLCLSSAKKVKVALHNAYRDVHFWRLSDGCDFEREARVAEVRARPQWTVEPLPPGKQLDPDADAGALKHLQQFTWLPGKHTWEEFDGPILDMGTSEIGGANRRFRLVVTNRGLQLAHLELDVQNGGPLKLPLRDIKLSPGQSADLMVDHTPLVCGEWVGAIIVRASWLNGDTSDARVPTYMRVTQPQGGEAARSLPACAPRPFRPGSQNRISIDPASTSRQQMRTPSVCSRPVSAVSCVTQSPSDAHRPPLPPGLRPTSALEVPDRAYQAAHAVPRAAGGTLPEGRPHSAPLSSLQQQAAAASMRRARSGSAGRMRSSGRRRGRLPADVGVPARHRSSSVPD